MTGKTFSLLALTAVFFSGCTMIPQYTRPEAPVPGGWPSGAAYKETASAEDVPVAEDLKWREFFADERLQAILETALKNNRDLRLAALNVERARALYRIQRMEILPTVDATGSGIEQRLPADLSGTGHSRTFGLYDVHLGISSWEIDFFGRIRSLEQRALEEYFATEEARRSAQLVLISEVADAYLTLAADRENLKLARSTLESQQAAYALIRRRYEAGVAPELDLLQARTRVEAARADAARFTGLTAQDRNALDLLAGSPVPVELLPETLSAVTPPQDIRPGTSSEVLLRRPDVLEAEHALKAANANIGAARAAFFPRISLTTALGTASGDLSGLFKPGSGAWNYGAQVVSPIFDPRIRPALKATQVEREIAQAQYEKAIQTAFREVADALAQRGTLGDQMDAQQSLVEAAAGTYRLSNARYTKGIDAYLNVLDAQRSLYAAEQGLISIRFAHLLNRVLLYAVLGGGGGPAVPGQDP
jgi:multidrug efflux system outer membrane protein